MNKPIALLTFMGVLVIAAGLVMADVEAKTSRAAAPPHNPPAQATPVTQEQEHPSNGYCLLCHSQTDRVWEAPGGETLPLEIDTVVLAASVHGDPNPEGALNCADCHADQRFPHEPVTAETLRELRLEQFASCRTCHEEQYTRLQDSIHGEALRSGRLEAAVCIDCHGAHDIQPPDEPRQRISFTCGQCHGAILEQYRTSVHGQALLAEGNPDVPTCIDCHGVHDIEDPTTTIFRVRSPQLCAECHADEELMAQYGITTNVFDSYLTEFHGTTVALFEQQDPNVATNKAVCFDCHGVHDIQPADEEGSQVIRENLLAGCQQCHPGATSNFSDAWIGHYPPALDSHPVLFAVNSFYDVLIPTVIGAFLLLIATDIVGRVRRRFSKRRKTEA